MKIALAGASGLVGSAAYRYLVDFGYDVVPLSSKDFDLRNLAQTRNVLKDISARAVINAAAKVGGIEANRNNKFEFLHDNLAMQLNLIKVCDELQTEILINLGSSCIYPRNSKLPISECSLLSNYLEDTNEGYAIAKIAGVKAIDYLVQQRRVNYVSLMPCNLYGSNDNYDLTTSHVIPALLDKFATAKTQEKREVAIWGSGRPLREFMHADDLAAAICLVLSLLERKDPNLLRMIGARSWFNVGTGSEISIQELCGLLRDLVGFKGNLIFDKSMPDGTYRKVMDSSRIRSLGWTPKILLKKGLSNILSERWSIIPE